MSSVTAIQLVSVPASVLLPPPSSPPMKAHHAPDGSFVNPWESFKKSERTVGFKDFFTGIVLGNPNAKPVPDDPKDRPVQVVKPVFDHPPDGIKATWIGHASWLVEFPSSIEGQRGITILLDPVWSERTSPVSFAGPKRYSPTPCGIDDLPFIDAVVISHSHYDHLDIHTLKALQAKQAKDKDSRPIRLFVPLGNKKWAVSNLGSLGAENIIELDWWEGTSLTRGDEILKIQCTPAQHFSGRTLTDRNYSLWASWLFTFSSPSEKKTLFFAGDTGYRAVPASICKPDFAESPYPGKEALQGLPCNPTFGWIGKNAQVDLALLPVGLFNLIAWQSQIHAAPWDSVDMHKDLRAKSSVAMHYGTVRGGISATYEPIDMPLRELRAACEREGIPHSKAKPNERLDGKGEFIYCDIGVTILA